MSDKRSWTSHCNLATFVIEISMYKLMTMIVLSALMLVGCNTVRGLGQDIEQAGEAIQRSTK